MPRTIEVQLYKFDELSDIAKDKARDWWRNASIEDEWWEFVYADAVQCVDILGIDIVNQRGKTNTPDIQFSGFSSQGDGACFNGSYSYKPGAPKAIRQHAPQDKELHRIADELQKLQRPAFYRLRGEISTAGHYCHSGTMSFSLDREIDFPMDKEQAVQQLMRDFADWIYKQLETEYDYRNADEQVDEDITANEYEFTADGKIS
jgi:hypothetical protein